MNKEDILTDEGKVICDLTNIFTNKNREIEDLKDTLKDREEYCDKLEEDRENILIENKKQKEILDKIKKYMQTLRDEYADDDYDIKCDVFNKIYYEILEEIE